MAPKAATPAAKAAATAATAAAAEAEKAKVAFRNFKAYAHRSDDPTRVQPCKQLSTWVSTLLPSIQRTGSPLSNPGINVVAAKETWGRS
eukprot:3558388-Amphidinium_carterae.1